METSGQASRDYELQEPIVSFTGRWKGLTLYGDVHFSLFLRKVFMELSTQDLDSISATAIPPIDGTRLCLIDLCRLAEEG
jgi:hypothetical protein